MFPCGLPLSRSPYCPGGLGTRKGCGHNPHGRSWTLQGSRGDSRVYSLAALTAQNTHTLTHTHTHTAPLMCHSFHRKATRLLDGCQQLVVQLVIVLVGGNVNPVKAGQRGKGDREGKGRGGEKEFGRERSTFLVWVDSFEKPLTFPIDKGITFYFRVKSAVGNPSTTGWIDANKHFNNSL